MIRVFDGVLAVAYALHDYMKDGHKLSPPILHHLCEAHCVEPWPNGSLLMSYIERVGRCPDLLGV